MNIKQVVPGSWNFLRLLRLALGVAIMVQAVVVGNWLMGAAGLLFTAMPLFNIGCCGTAGCATPAKGSTENKKDIAYEEVV